MAHGEEEANLPLYDGFSIYGGRFHVSIFLLVIKAEEGK